MTSVNSSEASSWGNILPNNGEGDGDIPCSIFRCASAVGVEALLTKSRSPQEPDGELELSGENNIHALFIGGQNINTNLTSMATTTMARRG